MPSVRLTIIVRLDQAASLNRLAEFVEVRRTVIGTDVFVALSADDGPAALKLFSDLGALAIPFEATATIGDVHYLAAGDGNQMSREDLANAHRHVERLIADSRKKALSDLFADDDSPPERIDVPCLGALANVG